MLTKLGMQLKLQLNLYIHLMTNQLTFKTHHSSKVYLKSQELSKHLDGLRVIAKFGDSITTDHISPAGAIGKDTPAGKYLMKTVLQSVTSTLTVLVVVTMK